jgi:undecaprenyl diphosphate synthase
VAIIMDGNRRFARKNHIALGAGHSLGFDKLQEVRPYPPM